MIDGWYDDPTGRYLRRWWQEMAWTNDVQRADGETGQDELTDVQLAMVRRPEPQVAWPYGAVPMFWSPYPRTNGMAIASLVVGVLGFSFWGIGSVLAIVFGCIARSQINRSGGYETGNGMAIAGIVLGAIQIVIFVIIVIAVISLAASTSS